MPPKQTLGSKHNKAIKPSGNMCSITIQSSINDNDESSLDSHSISSTTDVVTITANDQYYVRVSKQILQNELKGSESMWSQCRSYHYWRMARSLFSPPLQQIEIVNSGLKLTLVEVNHACRFMKYAEIHIKHRDRPHNELIMTIFPEEWHCQRKLTSALINLICHQSESLRTVSLSFFTASLSRSPKQLSPAIAATGFMTQLFENLKPHEIPINGTTIDFHRHITSIVVDFSRFSALPSAIIQPFCNYLQHLIAPPDSPADYHYGFSLFSKMQLFRSHIKSYSETDTHPEIQQLIDEMKKDMIEEFSSSLDLDSTWETFSIRTNSSSTGRGEAVSFPSTSLCALFVPARLHHAATILDLFQSFKSEMNTYCVVMFVFSGWFAGFFDAVTPSKKRLSIDDGTTLRISTFHKDQLKSVYLPELFRKAGRTTEQYFHAFQSLSLHHDCFDLCPINSLLKPNPNEHQPTSDEWDHIDLETIVVAIRTINDGHLSFTDSDWPLHNLALKILPQISNCATQMDQWQLERLLTPSINVLGKINFLPDSTNPRDSRDRDEVFLKVCRLCSQRVVSLCLGRMGFFSRFVSGLVVDDTSDECERVLRVLVNHEEGWQDALEFNFVQTSDKDRLNCQFVQIRGMMHFHGANIFRKISRYDTP
ncbi:hypothetical protein BLNAU_18474 [Blattamonas nauphoetae]|uniref:Uncharacterized protein n=1 Tax=Blattamonas nauphoetae TaxID=2049346 RepID=A0ABQ9X4X8_9EUKA|nr:hypothetical protein BLNAU_18474 [Blattamonas nauphoetae]